MASGKYIYNIQTQRFDRHRIKFSRRMLHVAIYAVMGFGIFMAYLLLVGEVYDIPGLRQLVLERRNAVLADKIQFVTQRNALQGERLSELEMRDNKVYRPIFGMDEIPAEVRTAGYASDDRYTVFDKYEYADVLSQAVRSQDVIEMRTYLQSRSYDDVEKVAMRMEDMAKCVPSLIPVCPGPGIHITSPFGYRIHPIAGYVIFHSGTDIAGPKGTPIFAAADGVVTEVRHNYHGYGNVVDIDHGFGYSTRYGHLQDINVEPGQQVNRGDQIATMGRSGRATGPHLHYEVHYLGKPIDPRNFYFYDLSPEDYDKMVQLSSNMGNMLD